MTQRRRGNPATSKAAQRAHEALVEQRDLRRKADVRAVMDTPAGRRFVWAQIEVPGTFGPSFTGNSGTFFNEGKRDVGIKLMVEVQADCPELYVVMLTEALAEQRTANLQKAQANDLAAQDEDTDA